MVGRTEPPSTFAPDFDVLLRALAHHEFEVAGQPAPDWTNLAPLGELLDIEHPFLDRNRVVEQTPAWLSGLNIFVPERDLITE